MEAIELRIGNLVWDDYSGEMTVFGIIDGGINPRIELRKSKNLPAGSYSIDKINPIPLTEEWLLKFGLQKTWTSQKDNSYAFEGVFNSKQILLFYWPEMMVKVNGGGFIDQKIQYLHQLQNLYFALTGSELTLNDSKDVHKIV